MTTMHAVSPEADRHDDDQDYSLKDTNPDLGERWPSGGAYGGRGWMNSERYASTYDLVEQTFYLYVRVVKAKDLPPSAITASSAYLSATVTRFFGKRSARKPA